MKKYWWILLIVVLVILLSGGVWFYFLQNKKSDLLTGTNFTSANSDRTVSIQGFEKPVLIPESFNADFQNKFSYTNGSGNLENDMIRILIAPDTFTTNNNVLMSGRFLVISPTQSIDASGLYQLVDEKKLLYRDTISSVSSSINYYQKTIENDKTYFNTFISTKVRENSTSGYYFKLIIKKPNASLEEKNKSILQAEQVLLQQFN
jgi:flagellar basal body-associated protein FliL